MLEDHSSSPLISQREKPRPREETGFANWCQNLDANVGTRAPGSRTPHDAGCFCRHEKARGHVLAPRVGEAHGFQLCGVQKRLGERWSVRGFGVRKR